MLPKGYGRSRKYGFRPQPSIRTTGRNWTVWRTACPDLLADLGGIKCRPHAEDGKSSGLLSGLTGDSHGLSAIPLSHPGGCGVYHPAGEGIQESVKCLPVVLGKTLIVQGFLEASKPLLATFLRYFKGHMPGSHSGRTMLLREERRTAQKLNKEIRRTICGGHQGFFLSGEEKANTGGFEPVIMISEQGTNPLLAQNSIDLPGRWGILRRAPRRYIYILHDYRKEKRTVPSIPQ